MEDAIKGQLHHLRATLASAVAVMTSYIYTCSPNEEHRPQHGVRAAGKLNAGNEITGMLPNAYARRHADYCK